MYIYIYIYTYKYIYIYTYIYISKHKQNAQSDGHRARSAIKHLLEALLLTIWNRTDFTADAIGRDTRVSSAISE